MATENISQEFSLKKIDKTKNYFIEEGNQYELKSKNHKILPTPLHLKTKTQNSKYVNKKKKK